MSSSNRLPFGSGGNDSYFGIKVEMPDGKMIGVEVRPIDTVAVLRAAIELETDIEKERQTLLLDGSALPLESTISEVGMSENTVVTVEIAKDEDEQKLEDMGPVDDSCIRVAIKTQISGGKWKSVIQDWPREKSVQDVMEETLKKFQMIDEQMKYYETDAFGLFKLDPELPPLGEMPNPKTGGTKLRLLMPREELKENMTLEAQNIQNGEELIFGNQGCVSYSDTYHG